MLKTKKSIRCSFALISALVLVACNSTPSNTEQAVSKTVYINAPNKSEYIDIEWPDIKKEYVISSWHGYGTSDAQSALNRTDPNIELVSLDKISGAWKARLGAGGEEELAINLASGRVTVLAEAKVNGIDLNKSSKAVPTFGVSVKAGCIKSVFGLLKDDKRRDFCDSEFSKLSANYSANEVATEVLTSFAQAALLSKMYKVSFDVEELHLALNESKIYEHLINEAADRRYKIFQSQFQKTKLDHSKSQTFINKYSNIAQLKNHDYLIEARNNARAYALTTTNDIDELSDIINKYKGDDLDGLVADAEVRLSRLMKEKYEREEQEKARIAMKQKQERIAKQRKKEQERLALSSWRKSLKVGDNTFCGRIIETNNNRTMYKLALSAKLSGYGSEQWVHINELYQPWRGCSNKNGHLSPLS
ncbi:MULTISPECIES: hypothetical protein [Pseudoalteromonas]|uniref:hypothetical protein n=1 Tax=Pseudoalteromonas TaxID=53246 RepID=UPI0015828A60|nr:MULTISPECIES: hypothetical protein [Pseudoalteromonas]MDI4654262.1 MICOS complex subunit MIC60 [Pseudoalteromonas shioyasakiensis]NUJ41140.1 hypothetical protein [Pseudoalteromonas sp. 0303]